MKKINSLINVIILLVVLFNIKSVNATSNVKIDVGTIGEGMTICSKSSKYDNNAHLYAWTKNEYGQAISSVAVWPGLYMTKTNNIYCYTFKSGESANNLIFNNGSNNVQTIDLSAIKDDGNLINKLLYSFENKNEVNYIGEWYVYDNSAIVNLVSSASPKVNNRLKYTKATYNELKTQYTNSSNIMNHTDMLSENTPYIVHQTYVDDRVVYSSPYIDAYNALSNAIEALRNRGNIIVNDSIVGGDIQASYVDTESDENYKVRVEADTADGYELTSLKLNRIESYNESEPVLGTEYTIPRPTPSTVEIPASDLDGGKGLYLNASFRKKVYTISFTIDDHGKVVSTDDDDNEYDVTDVVSIEHGDTFLAKILAEQGYEIKSATVNGENYQVSNNSIRLENVQSDQHVVIKFTLKTYTVSIDDEDFIFTYGTTYNEILEKINTTKEGYVFDGLIDKNKHRISKDYKVTSNDALYTVFKEKSADGIVNPTTGMNIMAILLLFGIVFGVLYVSGKKQQKKEIK